MSTPIYHLALPADWEAAEVAGRYLVSTRGRSLSEVGFIHCSAPEQVTPTANRFYRDLESLVLVEIDPDRVEADIRWEPPSPGSQERFPHLYGPLLVGAVNAATSVVRGPNGWDLRTG